MQAESIRGRLAAAESRFRLDHVHNLEEAQVQFAAMRWDVVLLEMEGAADLARFASVWAAASVPVVLLHGDAEEPIALRALRTGAADLLHRDRLEPALLSRTLDAAVERGNARAEAERIRLRQEAAERTLERLAATPATPVTARHFGRELLRTGAPDVFGELVDHYAELLDRALEERVFRMEHLVGDELRILASELGFLRAGPRDVIEIHTHALARRSPEVGFARAQAYSEEGRWMALELMGHLAAHYRSQAGATPRRGGRPDAKGRAP